jgi:hypothetical protein
MARKNKFTRRGILPIIGSSLLIPFIGSAQNEEPEQINEDDYQILLKPDGTSVKVKKSVLKQSNVKKKNISNKTFLKWIGKKV